MPVKLRIVLSSSALLLVAAIIAFSVTRTPPVEPARMAAAESEPGEELAEIADLSATDDETAEVARSSIASTTSRGAASARKLRVILEGITEEEAPLTTVRLTAVDQREEQAADVHGTWRCRGLTSEFDLENFLAATAAWPETVLDVEVDHPLHLVETTWYPLLDGRTVHEVRVRLVSAAVIHGRVTREDAGPASEGLVGALLLDDDFPIDEDGRAVECDPDGTFEIRLPASGRYALASYDDGHRPTTTRVDALLGERVDVGTLLLERGHSITGHALRSGRPLANVGIDANPPRWKTAADPDDVNAGMHETVYEGRTFASPERSVHLFWLPPGFVAEHVAGSRLDGRFELARQRAVSDENGAFAFRGLGSGEYLLRMRELDEATDAVPAYWDKSSSEDRHRIHGDRPALVVEAPAAGVEFDFRWTSVHFELVGDVPDEGDGRLILTTPSGGPELTEEERAELAKQGFSIAPPILSTDFVLAASEPTFSIQAPPGLDVKGDVVFPGREPAMLEFRTPDEGGNLVIPVEIVQSDEEEATLLIALATSSGKIPEFFTLSLYRTEREGDPPDERLVAVQDGALKVEGLRSGNYRVRVRAGDVSDYSVGHLFFENEIEGVELQPGEVTTHSITLRRSAGLRLSVRDENGAFMSGEYDLVDDAGDPAQLVIAANEWASSWGFRAEDGTYESRTPLEPGSYRLAIHVKGYAEHSATFTLRAGEYEDVEVTLAR